METLLPILQQVGSALWGRDLGGHHVPAYLVGGSHCHRSRSLPPALCDLQEARCVAAVPWGSTPYLGSHVARPTPHPSWSLALASPLSGIWAGLHRSPPELPTESQTSTVRFLEGLPAGVCIQGRVTKNDCAKGGMYQGPGWIAV